MNKRIKKKRKKIENKKLCERYPFLIPRHVWTDEVLWQRPVRKKAKGFWVTSPYSFTELDSMPTGWRKAFGKEMMEELREACIKTDYLEKLSIIQIKEKFGGLRFYIGAAPQEVHDVIKKYEEESYYTCIVCGRPATKVSLDWISPFCDCCANNLKERVQFKDINEFYN